MNKTNRTIGVILLALGILSIIGAVGVSIYSRAAMGNRITEFREEALPKLREGERSDLPHRFPAQRAIRVLRANTQGGIPSLLLISGGLFLVGGIVLLIVGNNSQQSLTSEVETKKPKTKKQVNRAAAKDK